MAESLTLLLRLFYRPVSAMSAILDRGSLLIASLCVLAVSLPLANSNPWMRFPICAPLLVLAVVYISGVLLLSVLFGRFGGFVASFQRDYSPLLDRKSTRLNSSHLGISYAVFCLKKT